MPYFANRLKPSTIYNCIEQSLFVDIYTWLHDTSTSFKINGWNVEFSASSGSKCQHLTWRFKSFKMSKCDGSCLLSCQRYAAQTTLIWPMTQAVTLLLQASIAFFLSFSVSWHFDHPCDQEGTWGINPNEFCVHSFAVPYNNIPLNLVFRFRITSGLTGFSGKCSLKDSVL